MLRGNWRKELEFGLIVAVCALLIILPISGLLLSEYAEVHRANAAYQQNAEHDRSAASEVISKTCFNADFAIFSKCITEKIAAYYHQQSTNQDLQAQQDMAYWAKTIFFLGIAQLAFSGFGIYFIWRSLELNRDAVTIARETMIAQTRPWLKFESVNLQKIWIDDTQVNVQVEFAVRNVGHSPALEVLVNPRLTIDSTESFIPKDTRREPLVAKGWHAGSTVFNGDYWPYPVSFPITLAEIAADRARQIARNVKAFANRPELSEFAQQTFPPQFWIIANVQYEFVGSTEVHQTSVQFMIWKRNPDGPPGTGFTIPLAPEKLI